MEKPLLDAKLLLDHFDEFLSCRVCGMVCFESLFFNWREDKLPVDRLICLVTEVDSMWTLRMPHA